MRICVTKKDIAKARLALADGIMFRSQCCPVAQSFKRRGFPRILVARDVCWVDGLSIPLPNAAMKFIQAFDDGRRVSPITFTIEKA